MQIRKLLFPVIILILLSLTGCQRNVISGDVFVLSEILEIGEHIKMIGYNLSTTPQTTYLVTTDSKSNILEKRVIGTDLYMKGFANLDKNLIILFTDSKKQSLLTLINEQGEVVKSLTLAFQGERLLLHPAGGYVIPGYSAEGNPSVITLDAFWEPSKIIQLKGKYLFDAVLTEGRLTYVSMDADSRKCHLYTGNMDSFYDFDNPTGSNCSLTTLRNMIQLHYLSSANKLELVNFNILNRIESTESYKISKSDYVEVKLAEDDSFYYIAQSAGKGGNQYSRVYRLKNQTLTQIKTPELKKVLLSRPYETGGNLFSLAFDPKGTSAQKCRIVTLN